MVIRNKLFAATAIGSVLFGLQVSAAEIERNTAQMQAMDKITGRISVVEVPVNSEVNFGSFSILVRACKTTPPEETPENYAFVDVADSSFGKMQFNIFKGWMMSSSPALNAVEHPIYDVWLLKCLDTDVNKSKLLTAEQLKERDTLPKLADIKQEATKKTSEPEVNKSLETPEVLPASMAEEPKDKVLESYTNPAAATTETVSAATVPLADAQSLETPTANLAEATVNPAEETVENTSGPQSLLNIPDASVTTLAPSDAASNRPDIKVDEANIIESSDWVEVPANAPTAEPIEAVAPVVAPEPPIAAPAPLLSEPTAETTTPVVSTVEQPASEDVQTDNRIETLPEDEEDQFIDLSNEADATAALEAELSAEALKN